MFTLLRVLGTPPGAAHPAQIEIVGSFSCPGTNTVGIPLELRVTDPLGGPTTIFTQTTSTGAPGTLPLNTVAFLIPAWAASVCGSRIEFEVRGNCGGQWTPWQLDGGEIDCLSCPRGVSLHASYGACSGMPVKQRITLTATIMLSPGSTITFSWDFGDGQRAVDALTNTTRNWNTPLTLSRTHDYDPNQGPYTVWLSSVECPPASLIVSPHCNQVACCDEVTLSRSTQPLPCLPAGGGTVSVQYTATLSPMGCSGPFEWKVTNDLTGLVIQPFTPGGSTFSYLFASAGNYKVNVRVKQDSSCDDSVLSDSDTFSIAQCPTGTCSVAVSGPQQTTCTDGAPTPPQTYTAMPSVPFAGPYNWEVSQSPATLPFYQTRGGVSFTFAFPGPGTYTVSVSVQTQGCINSTTGNSVIVTVPPCPTQCPPGEHRDANGKCVTGDELPDCPKGEHRDSNGNCVRDKPSSRISCDALLWISLILIALSGVLAVIGCIISKTYPPAAAVLGIIAIVLLVVGLLLFLLWWAICRFFTACSVIIAAMHFMGVLISVFFVVGVILGLIAKFLDPSMWLCMGVAFFQSGIWGLLLYILYRIAVAVGCLTENPAGPKPPSSSSSGLSSFGGARAQSQNSLSNTTYRMEGQVGLGDIVKQITWAMGIRPCVKCHERAARLNEWVTFSGKRVGKTGS